MNLWGFWSDKMVVEKTTLSVLEWLTSAIIGYVVMQQVNKVITKVKLSRPEDSTAKN